jgi:hypothetical protein
MPPVSVNRTPAASNAFCMTFKVAGFGIVRPFSNLTTVLALMPAALAKSRTPQSSAARAILHCVIVNMRSVYTHMVLDATFCIAYEGFTAHMRYHRNL